MRKRRAHRLLRIRGAMVGTLRFAHPTDVEMCGVPMQRVAFVKALMLAAALLATAPASAEIRIIRVVPAARSGRSSICSRRCARAASAW